MNSHVHHLARATSSRWATTCASSRRRPTLTGLSPQRHRPRHAAFHPGRRLDRAHVDVAAPGRRRCAASSARSASTSSTSTSRWSPSCRSSSCASPTAINVGTFHAAREGGARLYAYTRRLLMAGFRRLDGKIAVSHAAAQPDRAALPRLLQHHPQRRRRRALRRAAAAAAGAGRRHDQHPLRRAAGEAQGAALPAARLRTASRRSARTRGSSSSAATTRARSSVYERLVRESRPARRRVRRLRRRIDDLPRYHHSAAHLLRAQHRQREPGHRPARGDGGGLPVVASNIDGFAGVITHGVEGLLVRPQDGDALGDALLELADDPDAARDDGRQGQRASAALQLGARLAARALLLRAPRLRAKQARRQARRTSKLVEASADVHDAARPAAPGHEPGRRRARPPRRHAEHAHRGSAARRHRRGRAHRRAASSSGAASPCSRPPSLDAFDGTLARTTGRVTRFGGVFDSTVDRLFEGVVLGGLLYYYLDLGRAMRACWSSSRWSARSASATSAPAPRSSASSSTTASSRAASASSCSRPVSSPARSSPCSGCSPS